jgi:Uma2 family endonuclease
MMSDQARVADPPRTLVEGLRLDQRLFHALYQATPRGTRAELIDGVVYMPSPDSIDHGLAQVSVIMWLGQYVEQTPGVQALDNATTILGWRSELQPDGLLRILPEFGGRTRNEKGYVHGAPELVVEVSKATRYVDLGPKLADYERAGVLEYVVRTFEPDEIFWFVLDKTGLVERPTGDDGLYRSAVFPGLWLDPTALFAGDTRRQRLVVEAGCARPEHGAFVDRLAKTEAGG